MKYAADTITPALRQEIGEATAALLKCIKRTEKNNRALLKMREDLASLEDEHAELAGKKTLTRAEGNTIQSVVAQKERLARTIEQESASGGQDWQIVRAMLSSCQDVTTKLLTLALEQVRTEVMRLLAPYFVAAQNRVYTVARETDAEAMMTANFRRPFTASFSLEDSLAKVKELLSLLEDIAADRDFFTLEPAAPLKKAA